MPPETSGYRPSRSPSSLVLEYHAVSESWNSDLAVKPAQLRAHLEHLLAEGFRGTTFTQAALHKPADRVVAVTFDDAHLSVFELAYPLLVSLGVPGTVFVVTDYADKELPLRWRRRQEWDAEHDAELRGMTWDHARQLADAGWEIGSHTRTHPRLTTLSDAELESELRGSREAVEQAVGKPCTSLAYPFGDADERVARMAAAAGYTVAAVEVPGPATPMMWPRVGIYRADGMRRFRLKVSPTVRYARARLTSFRRLVRGRSDSRGRVEAENSVGR